MLAHVLILAQSQRDSYSPEQQQSINQAYGMLWLIGIILLVGVGFMIAIAITRRVARTTRQRIEADLAERQPTDVDDTWSTSGRRVAVEPAADNLGDADEPPPWSDSSDDDGPDEPYR